MSLSLDDALPERRAARRAFDRARKFDSAVVLELGRGGRIRNSSAYYQWISLTR